jgi:hypothetical protein
MSRSAAKSAKFLLTRVMTAAGATAIFVALWAAVATTGSAGKQANGSTQDNQSAPIEQDGWRWDAAANTWVPIAQPAAAPALEQVVVVERQPVYYYVRYVTEVLPAPTAGSGASSKPAATTTAAGAPAAAPSLATSAAPAAPDTALPSPASAPAAPAPAAPAPAPPTAAAPPVAAKPAPPAPAPAAPKKTKAS